MYLYQLEQAFCLYDENVVLLFHLDRAELWLTEFNKHNGIT